jgi:hypothetical protein
MFPDAIGLGKNDRKSGDDIAQHALQGKADAEPRDAKTRNQRGDLKAQLVERNQDSEEDHDQFDKAYEKKPNGRFEVVPIQPLFRQCSNRAGGECGHPDDHHGSKETKSVLNDVLGYQVRD